MASFVPPSFFKIFLETASSHLRLPTTFVTKHLVLVDKIKEKTLLRSENGVFTWPLKIEKIDGSYSIAHGWNQVVKDTLLSFGDLLVFNLVDESTFIVSIYSPSGCRKDLPSKIDVEHHEDLVSEDDVEKDDGGGGGDGDGDPFFTIIISNTHNVLCRLPLGFVELAGIDPEEPITLKNVAGKEWQMKMVTGKSSKQAERFYLSSGWQDFRRSNGLLGGEECVFKFIRNEGKLCLEKVTKTKVTVRQPIDECSAKRKRGRPPRVREHGGCEEVEVVVKRPRGRPRKQKSQVVYF